jgi:hypothetical protein
MRASGSEKMETTIVFKGDAIAITIQRREETLPLSEHAEKGNQYGNHYQVD